MSDEDDDGAAEDDEAHPACGEEAGSSPVQTICAPQGRTHTVVATAPAWEALRNWPRYAAVEMIREGRKNRGHPRLLLPNDDPRALTPAMMESYVAATRRPYQVRSGGRWVSEDQEEVLDTKPKKNSPYTWGPFVTCRVPVSTIEFGDAEDAENVLRWYPPTDDRAQWWTFRIYNITVETPGQERHWPNRAWLPYIQRTVMRIPIQHLRATRFRGVYLAFTVGAPLLPEEIPKKGVVATGGSNNLLNRRMAGPRRFGAESGVLTTVDITYAALNRPWAQPLGAAEQRLTKGPASPPATLPAPDAPNNEVTAAFERRPRPAAASTPTEHPVEDWFLDPLSIQDTILHEFGHLLDKVRPAFINYVAEYGGTREEWRVEVARSRRAFSRLRTGRYSVDPPVDQKGPTWQTFHEYIDEIHYGGSTLDATEGFSECYKRHFSGLTLAEGGRGNPGTHGTAALALFMANGFPTLDSVRRAALAQAHFMAGEPNLVIENPSPDPWNPHNDHERERATGAANPRGAEGA